MKKKLTTKEKLDKIIVKLEGLQTDLGSQCLVNFGTETVSGRMRRLIGLAIEDLNEARKGG